MEGKSDLSQVEGSAIPILKYSKHGGVSETVKTVVGLGVVFIITKEPQTIMGPFQGTKLLLAIFGAHRVSFTLSMGLSTLFKGHIVWCICKCIDVSFFCCWYRSIMPNMVHNMEKGE